LDEAVSRLKQAREALTEFRTRTQIVDPQSDLQGRMGVVNNLQQQLASALIELDLLIESNNTSDPRMQPARQKIEVIRKRITEERDSFSQGNELGAAYPGLLAEYEGLIVEREFAEETYRATLAALGIARTKASRQSRYLSTYVEPTLAETSEYPQRLLIGGLAGLFLLLSWSVIVLIYYSIRDRA
jgi:capsular polysaccharide transport system permease protein